MSSVNHSVFLLIDMQDKLLNAVQRPQIVERAAFVLKTCDLLGVPVIVTEQYPNGLGPTIRILADVLPEKAMVVEKTDFSAFKVPDVVSFLENIGRRRVILCGVETHICVFQTALDLLKAGYDVCLLAEASAARFVSDEQQAIEVLKARGAEVWSAEMVIFDWMQSARHPHFKSIQSLVKGRLGSVSP